MKNNFIKKILLIIIIIMVGTIKVSAATNVENIEQLANELGLDNVSLNEHTITLQNDITLDDYININEGNYVIDLNGKSITYTKNMNNFALYIYGGNVTIKDSLNNGKIIGMEGAIYCDSGFLKVINGTFDGKGGTAIMSGRNGFVQVDDGIVDGISTWNGNLIINGGTFKYLIADKEPIYIYGDVQENNSKVRINGGVFSEGITLWGNNIDTYIRIKGGEFKSKGVDSYGIPTYGIYHNEQEAYNLSLLLEDGYKFDNDSKRVEEVYHEDGSLWYVESTMDEAKVVKKNENVINKNTVLFVDYDGTILTEETVFDGESIIAPEEPKREGYVFTGWNGELSNINKDMIVTPNYEKIYEFNVENLKIFSNYTGNKIEPNILVRDELTNNFMELGKDYEISYEDIINAGKYTISIKGIGKYKNAQIKEVTLEVLPLPVDSNNTKIEYKNEYIYTGNKIIPSVKVIYKNKTLKKGTDYKVIYENNTNAGVAELTIKGIGNYKGEICKFFNILPKELNENDVYMDLSDKVYQGNTIEPEAYAKDGDKVLTKDVDYKVYYRNNHINGIATIILSGIGNYSGKFERNFNIVLNDISKISSVNIDIANKTYTGSAIKTNIKLINEGKLLQEGIDYTVEYSNNKNAGIATVIIKGIGIYTGKIEKNYIITKQNINKISTITIDIANKTYTGSTLKTSIKLINGDKVLVEGTDYTVTYSNNKNIGTASVTIKGIGNYEGTISKTFKIVPRKINITSLKNIFLRIVTISWNKDTSVSGYEIYRSTSQNGSYSLVKTVTKNSTNSATFVAQKKGTYYYKIRSYVTVNGIKIYSDFSDIQKVIVSK